MPISVIFGGQYGSEGKGKTAFFIAKSLGARAVVRVGGPNSGHTITDSDGTPIILKQLPVSAYLSGVYSVITAGNYINLDILQSEIRSSGINETLLKIDPHAVLITQEDIENEAGNGLIKTIGSTGSGTGSAISRRLSRKFGLRFAKDEPKLTKFLTNTGQFLSKLLKEKERIIVEGTQGFALSLLHSEYYPYTTSRDTSAAAFVSEAGLSPIDVDDVIMVIRSFPIRVAGTSGPLPAEINWSEVTEQSGSSHDLIELTSVSKNTRRVAEFDPEIVRRSIQYNNPTKIVLNHVDYIDAGCKNGYLSKKAYEWVRGVQASIDRPINYLGFDRNELYSNPIIVDSSCESKENYDSLLSTGLR